MNSIYVRINKAILYVRNFYKNIKYQYVNPVSLLFIVNFIVPYIHFTKDFMFIQS